MFIKELDIPEYVASTMEEYGYIDDRTLLMGEQFNYDTILNIIKSGKISSFDAIKLLVELIRTNRKDYFERQRINDNENLTSIRRKYDEMIMEMEIKLSDIKTIVVDMARAMKIELVDDDN